MKTSKITTVIATLSLVLFLSVASYADSGSLKSGDLPKSGDKSVTITNTAEKDFNYLRFDVTKYINENEESDLAYNSLDYIRFDVNKYMNQPEVEVLPMAIELEYLHFDINNFINSNSDNVTELPEDQFDNLRFDVNKYMTSSNSEISDLPVKE